MATSRGTSLLNNRHWIEHRYGADGVKRLLAAVSPEDRLTLSTAVAVGWYDLGVEVRMLHAIDEVLVAGDRALLVEMGRFTADRDFGGVQRLFFRLANPAFVMEKAMAYWNRYYDTGRWEIRRVASGADGALLDFARPDELFCVVTTGYLARMFELVGARDVRVEHPRCRGRGDLSCLFQGRWRQ
jgi:hypothetical protein